MSHQHFNMNMSTNDSVGLKNTFQTQQLLASPIAQSQSQEFSMPPNWGLLTEAQRTGILYQMNARNTNMQSIIAEQRNFRKVSFDLNQRMNN